MSKIAKFGHAKILTANDLLSGGVVFATAKDSWSPFISQAQLSSNSTMIETLKARGQQAVDRQLVVEPFFIDVTVENELPRPIKFREQLRVYGPSVKTALAKPAYDEAA